MARTTRTDDFEDDYEGPDGWGAGDEDYDDDDGDAGDVDDSGTVDCPHCGREISEYAERCPRCGTYVSEEDAPTRSMPRWAVITAAVLLAAMVVTMLWGVF